MRRTIVIEHAAHHPNTPLNDFYIEPHCWMVFVEGQPFMGLKTREHASKIARMAIDTGRYEYVDVRRQPEMRVEER